jgi:hypothetical protein
VLVAGLLVIALLTFALGTVALRFVLNYGAYDGGVVEIRRD